MPFRDVREADTSNLRISEAIHQLLSEVDPLAVLAQLTPFLSDTDARRRKDTINTFQHVLHRFDAKSGRELAKTMGALLADDPSAEVRQEAARTLGRLRADAHPAIQVIIKALEDPDVSVQDHAVYALHAVGPDAWPAVPLLTSRLEHGQGTSYHLIMALRHIGTGAQVAVPTLVARLSNDHDAEDADWALLEIGGLRREHVPALLLGIATGQTPHMACRAIELHPENPAVATAILQGMDGPEDHVSLDYARCLVRLAPRHPSLLYELAQRLQSRHEPARIGAAYACCQLDRSRDKAIQVLVASLIRQTPEWRKGGLNHTAIEALGLLGPRARVALPQVRKHWEIAKHDASQSGQINRAVLAPALWRLGGDHQEALAVLEKDLQGDDSVVHDDCCRAVRQFGPLALSAVPACEALLKRGGQDDRSPRWRVMSLLKDLGPATPTRALLPLLRELMASEESPYNRRIAAEAYWTISGDAATTTTALVELLADRSSNLNWTLQALADMGSEAASAAPALTTMAESDPAPGVRRQARQTLEAVSQAQSHVAPSPAMIQQWWNDLADEDQQVACRAVWRLARTKALTADSVEARLKREQPKVDAELVGSLIGDLDHPTYPRREAATEKLRQMLPAVASLLREAHKNTASAEARWRLDLLLRQVPETGDTYQPAPYQRQQARAQQVLKLQEHLLQNP
ncbi:MAG: HEAT repeat domain-containing protein [Phycisphaeraceae bacterium]